MGKFIDLTGQRFGRLVVLEKGEPYKSPKGYTQIRWVCRCDCGKEVLVCGDALKRGTQVSCGCYRDDQMRERFTTHGKTDSRPYYVWSSMKSRCTNPNVPRYTYYGGRGIFVCEEWSESFEAFYEWLIENGYDENAPRGQYTVDRIDCDGPYCPENCRLISQSEQVNNLRSNRWIECEDERHTLAQWGRITGIPSAKIRNRIDCLGWTPERALHTA